MAQTRKKRDVFDVIAVFVLSITAVVTAWCGFEASKWGGDMSIAFSQASSARVQATAAEGQARDARQYDLTIWTQYVLAEADGNTQLMTYIEQRFTPEFRTAFEAWNTGDRVEQGPFAMKEYVPPGTAEAKKLSQHADKKFEQALASNQRGDDYTLLTVLFALVLFLTAMSQRDLVPWVRWTLLSLAMVVGAAGIVIMLTFPILI
ncbi:hypothetical protein L2X99_15615 [Microbacterium sp. KUDC0406]|uniref:hypothetical protein n=1 Tax=Microbacterium sp. KUDC0406 TaxID=2909588 RepID=UPI001F1E8A4F|nr:hypothetical protein [Microbacterium sp. KUDC0406]UJP09796.1 hypothetical protein L2X99_15615 [Microbacterium sp. KUDC0406]